MRLGMDRKWLAAVCLGLFSGLAAEVPAATIHLVVAADTLDSKIGKNVQVDLNAVVQVFQENVPEQTRVLSVIRIDGPRCTPDQIRAAIDRLPVGPDDAVAVFYHGHGAYDPQIGHYLKFPRLNEAFLARSDLIARIKRRGARLGVVATDCCNKLSILPKKRIPKAPTVGVPAPPTQVSPLFTALFLNAAGFVELTSSKQDEESISYPTTRDQNGLEIPKGGLFTTALVDLFESNKRNTLTWQQVAESVGQQVQTAFRRLKPDGLDNPDEPEKPQMTQTVVASLSVRLVRPPADPGEPPLPPFEPPPSYGAAQSLGIVGYENQGRGIFIYASKPGGPAARLGLEQGDVILAVNDNSIRTARGYQQTLMQAEGAVRLVFQDVRTRQVRSADVMLDGDGFRPLPFKPEPGAPPTFGASGSPAAGGIRIDATVPGSPSALLQLDPGDIISAVNGKPVATMDQLNEAVDLSPDEMWFDILNVRTGKPQAMLVSLSRPVNRPPGPDPDFPGPIGGRNLTFGVHGYENGDYGIQVHAVAAGSPAARIGLERGDILQSIDGIRLRTVQDYRRALNASSGQIELTLRDVRTGESRTTQVALEARSSPETLPEGTRRLFGVLVAETPGHQGLLLQAVTPNSAANFSGLDPGDLLVSINDVTLRTVDDFRRALRETPDEMIFVVRNIRTGQLQGMVTRLDR